MTRICSVSRMFQTDCKLFVCTKEKTETKRDISVDPRTLGNKAAETIF